MIKNPQCCGNWEEYAEHSLTHDPEPDLDILSIDRKLPVAKTDEAKALIVPGIS